MRASLSQSPVKPETQEGEPIDGGFGFDVCTPGGGFNTISRCEVIT